MGVKIAGADPAVLLVDVDDAGVAGTQLQGGGGFPAVGEAVELFEVFDSAVGADFGEQAAASDGLQLGVVTDEDEPPAVLLRRG